MSLLPPEKMFPCWHEKRRQVFCIIVREDQLGTAETNRLITMSYNNVCYCMSVCQESISLLSSNSKHFIMPDDRYFHTFMNSMFFKTVPIIARRNFAI